MKRIFERFLRRPFRKLFWSSFVFIFCHSGLIVFEVQALLVVSFVGAATSAETAGSVRAFSGFRKTFRRAPTALTGFFSVLVAAFVPDRRLLLLLFRADRRGRRLFRLGAFKDD